MARSSQQRRQKVSLLASWVSTADQRAGRTMLLPLLLLKQSSGTDLWESSKWQASRAAPRPSWTPSLPVLLLVKSLLSEVATPPLPARSMTAKTRSPIAAPEEVRHWNSLKERSFQVSQPSVTSRYCLFPRLFDVIHLSRLK